MPIHDWTRVDAGIFHHFHHCWTGEIADVLNEGLLPSEYYALAEQHAGGFGPDVLTLQGPGDENDADVGAPDDAMPVGQGSLLLAPVTLRPTAETDLAFYRRKQNVVSVRRVSGDRVVAVIEIVSRGNKAARNPLAAFVQKAAELLESGVHLLIVDLYPPGPRDPTGIHGTIWQEIAGEQYVPPPGKPLTLAAYDSGISLRTFVEAVAVGDALPEMPLFLEPEHGVMVPLEKTYTAAFATMPRRWRRVLE
jgi:hypothetical protein